MGKDYQGRRAETRNQVPSFWNCIMQKLQEMGRSGHRIKENQKRQNYILPPIRPPTSQTGLETDGKRSENSSGKLPSCEPCLKYPEIFYNLERIHALNLRQILT